MIHEVTEPVSRAMEAPKENVRVIVTEVPKLHRGIGGVSAENSGK
ncbi:tautomerase family protein [Salinicoccus sp. HZC-1]